MKFADIQELDLQEFHFLRPAWLWLLLVLLFLTFFIYFSNQEKAKWRNLIAEHLRKYMFSRSNRSSQIWPIIFFVLALSFAILAMAGPTWKRVEVPGMKSTAVMMIMLDLSWSMMADDIQPNRLERAKLKVRDLMDANPRARASVFVYAGTVHPVMTLTSDYKIIKYQVDNLRANIMPVRGDDLNLAMELADSAFSRFEAPSTLVLITDEVEQTETQSLLDFVNNSPHSIELLVMSTPAGAEVPGFRRGRRLVDNSGSPVVSQADPAVWNLLDQNSKIRINNLTLDKSDVEGIAARVREDLVFQLEDAKSEEEWQDEGLLFLIPTLFFTMFFFRKGWMIQWCVILGMVGMSSCVPPDNERADWWYTPDYRGQLFEKEGSYTEAADSYQDNQRKAVAYYKAGDYEAAGALFAQDSSAQGRYNYGLAMANLGNYEEAQQAFENALEDDPSMESARSGLDEVKQAIAEVDSISRFSEASEAIPEQDRGPLNEREAQSEDDELTSDTEVEELPESGDRITDEVTSEMRQAEELERPPEDQQQQGREIDAQNILLRGISADPSEFLRRRFRYQREKYFPDIKEGEKKW